MNEFNETKVEGIINPVTTNDVAEVNSTNKKSKWKFIIGGLFVIAAIAVGLFIGYNKIYGNPISIYKNTINSVYKKLSNTLKEADKNTFNVNFLEEPVTLGLDVKLDSSMPELKKFSGLNYNLEFGFDLKNELANVNMGIAEDNEDIIRALISFINDKAYLKCEQLFNKVLSQNYDVFADMDLEDIKDMFDNLETGSVDYETYDYILKEFKNIIIDSLDKNKFSVSNEKINIADKKYSVKKVTYLIDEENAIRTSKFVFKKILDNDKLIEAIAKCSGVSSTEIKRSLNEELNDADNITMESDLEIVLYADNLNIVVAGALIVDDEEVIKFECAKEVNIIFGNDVDGVLIEEEDDYYNIIVYQNNIRVLDGMLYKLEDSIKFKAWSLIDGVEVNFNLEIKDIKETKDEVSFNMIFGFDMNLFGKDVNANLDMIYSIKRGDIEIVDPLGSVSMDSLSEEEMMEAYNKLENILKRFGLDEIMDSM